jgi:hypothetical protein
MLKEIREAVHRTPFVPFSIELSSGEMIPVPHPDHILAGRTYVAVENDAGVINVLSALHIARIRWQERENTA